MGGGRTMIGVPSPATSGRTARRGAAVTMVVAALALAGCTPGVSRDGEPTRVDFERAEALRTDPWLAAAGVETTRYTYGTNGQYEPGTAGTLRPMTGTPAETMAAEVAAAAEVGWWPYYGRCPGAPVPGLQTADYYFGTDFVVVLVRELEDGSLAQAELSISDHLKVVATVANHMVPPVEMPEEVDLSQLACTNEAGQGLPTVGTPTNLTDWLS